MSDFEYYRNIDKHPFTGTVKTDFMARVSDAPYLNKFFDGTENCSQVENVTQGKVYTIYQVVGYGDVADFYFMNDINESYSLGSFFFEEGV